MSATPPPTEEPTPSLFGTDGIRDLAGAGRLSDESVTRIGRGLARFARQEAQGAAVILLGRDPRPSGEALTRRLAAAMAAAGASVHDGGVLPSPAVAWLSAAGPYALGCSVSASHNPADYNGVKAFLGDGGKLSAAQECDVEALMEGQAGALPSGAVPSDAVPSDAAPEPRHEPCASDYIERTAAALAEGGAVAGLRLVVDLSAGAATRTAPRVFGALGLEPTFLHEAGSRPINDACGTEHPETWLAAVRAQRADAGLAFDGDADRVLIADETGALLDGDDLLAILAADLDARGGVPADAVVSTVMANLGLHEFLAARGVTLVRTPVGDRNVAARMRTLGAVLGGEPAGHVVLPREDLPDATPLIGDGLFAGVRVLQAARRLGRPLSALRALRPRRPQRLVNVRMQARRELETWPALQAAIERERERLGEGGRFVVRYSGTEPLLRVMAEGREADAVEQAAQAVADVARKA